MTIAVVGDYVVKANQTLSFSQEWAFALQQPDGDVIPRLINSGSVTVSEDRSGHGAIGVYTEYGGADQQAVFWNRAGGSFTVEAVGEASRATGAFMVFSSGQVVNDGTLTVTSVDYARGVLVEAEGLVQNNGALIVQGANEAIGVQASAADVVNAGTITVEGDEAWGLENSGISLGSFVNTGSLSVTGVSWADAVGYSVSSLRNDGTISAHAASSIGAELWAGVDAVNNGRIIAGGEVQAFGLMINGDVAGAVTILNIGRIYATTAVGFGNDFGQVTVALTNAGHMVGAVVLGSADDQLVNLGKILGDVSLGGGDDVYDGRRGKVSGALDGGEGDDRLLAGKHHEAISGGSGHDSFAFYDVTDSRAANPDLISDLSLSDSIDLSRIDADTHHAGNQAFHLVSSFTGAAGELMVVYDSGKHLTTISGDVNGDGAADFAVTASGDHHDFTAFVL